MLVGDLDRLAAVKLQILFEQPDLIGFEAIPLTTFAVNRVDALERSLVQRNEVGLWITVLDLRDRASPTAKWNVWKVGVGHAGLHSNRIADTELGS